LTPSPS